MAKQIVEEVKIGRIYHVNAWYTQDWGNDKDAPMVWRFNKELAGSGSLGDICGHSIDTTLFITGLKFVNIVGNLETMITERPIDEGSGRKEKVTVDDVTQFLCTFDTGATGCYEATRFATGRNNHYYIKINGEKGSL